MLKIAVAYDSQPPNIHPHYSYGFIRFGSPPDGRSAVTQSLVEGNTAFALDLYGQLKTSSGNLFFSPYSISTCLAMTYAGARAETEKQMGQALHFQKNQRQLHSAFGELQRQLTEASKLEGIELNIANALWTQKGPPLLPAFLQIAKGEYQSNVSQADFRTGAEEARDKINRWVAQKTKDKIQKSTACMRREAGHLHLLILSCQLRSKRNSVSATKLIISPPRASYS